MKVRHIYARCDSSGKIEARELFLRQFADCLAGHAGKDIRVTIERKRKTRSLNQNAFFHGPFLEAVTDMFNDAGNNVSPVVVKEMLKERFGPKEYINTRDGKTVEVPKSSADWTTEEIENVMEQARAWGAGYGYSFPFPNEEGLCNTK